MNVLPTSDKYTLMALIPVAKCSRLPRLKAEINCNCYSLSPQTILESGEIIHLHLVIPNICCKHLIGVNASILYQGNKESRNDLLPAQLHILL